MVRLATRRASWHLRKEVVFEEMDQGSNLEPRATEEDALYLTNVPAPPSSVFTFLLPKETYSENQASLTNRASFLMISSNHKRAIAYCKYGCAQGLDSQAQKPHFRLDDAWMDRSVIKSSS